MFTKASHLGTINHAQTNHSKEFKPCLASNQFHRKVLLGRFKSTPQEKKLLKQKDFYSVIKIHTGKRDFFNSLCISNNHKEDSDFLCPQLLWPAPLVPGKLLADDDPECFSPFPRLKFSCCRDWFAPSALPIPRCVPELPANITEFFFLWTSLAALNPWGRKTSLSQTLYNSPE